MEAVKIELWYLDQKKKLKNADKQNNHSIQQHHKAL